MYICIIKKYNFLSPKAATSPIAAVIRRFLSYSSVQTHSSAPFHSLYGKTQFLGNPHHTTQVSFPSKGAILTTKCHTPFIIKLNCNRMNLL